MTSLAWSTAGRGPRSDNRAAIVREIAIHLVQARESLRMLDQDWITFAGIRTVLRPSSVLGGPRCISPADTVHACSTRKVDPLEVDVLALKTQEPRSVAVAITSEGIASLYGSSIASVAWQSHRPSQLVVLDSCVVKLP